MVGVLFLVGIVIGCLTVTRLGDIYGRKPLFQLGLLLHILVFSVLIFNTSIPLGMLLIFTSGYAVTMKVFIGFTYNLEMMPKQQQVIASTCQFCFESLVFVFCCFYFQHISKDWRYL